MKEKILNAFCASCTGGIIAMGAYNAFILVRYFSGGRKGQLFRSEVFLADAAVFAGAFLILFALWLIFHSLGGGKGSGANGSV